MELKKGETIMIDAALHLPAAFLHEAFSNRSGLPPDHFELYYRGKLLEGEAALSSWGIEKDSTIEVKMRGRGGGPGTSSDGGRLGPRRPAAGGGGGSGGASDSGDGVGGTKRGGSAEVRLATLSDLPQLLELEAQWDSEFLRSSEATLRQRLELHPGGQFVAFGGDGTLLAAMYTQRVASMEVLQHGPSVLAFLLAAGHAATNHSRGPPLAQGCSLGPKESPHRCH